MMEGNCTHHGLRRIYKRSRTVSSCAALGYWSRPSWCCWHCGNLLCSRHLFLHLGNCWGDVSVLRDCFHCCSASRHYYAVAAVGKLVGSGWRQVGYVRLASCHMPFVVHSIQYVYVLGGVPISSAASLLSNSFTFPYACVALSAYCTMIYANDPDLKPKF